VVFHAGQWLGDRFWIGAAGVDVFFVISGVIIWRMASGPEAAPAVFAWRRLTRVAPAYWLATLAVAAAAVAWRAWLPGITVDARRLALSLAFIPHHDAHGQVFPLLPPGWTLDYEAAFYLIVALALFAPRGARFGLIVAALGVVSFAGLIDAPLYELGANPLMLEFAAGAWIAWRGVRLAPRGGTVLVLAAVALLGAETALGLKSDLFRPLLFGLPATLIVAGALAVEPVIARTAPRALIALGDASYAIYLCHFPAVGLVARLMGTTPGWAFVAAATAASIGAGLAFHRLAERPLIAAARAIPKLLAR
jgi:exopolysaccharide production protein ExoZ